MIDRAGEGDLPAGQEIRRDGLGFGIDIKSPIGAAGDRDAVQSDIAEGGADLTGGVGLHFLRDHARDDAILPRVWQGGMESLISPQGAEGERKGHQRTKAPPPLQKKAGAQGRKHRGRGQKKPARVLAEQNAQREKNRHGRDDPAPLTGGHTVSTLPGTASVTAG